MDKCEICNQENKKYKCPKCTITYCSVKCYRSHKNDGNSCEENQNQLRSIQNSLVETPCVEAEVVDTYQFPTEHTVPVEKLKLLGRNEHLKVLLKNPHLRTMLTALSKTKNVHHAMNMVMLEPIFVEFAMECLSTVEDHHLGKDEAPGEEDRKRMFVEQIKQLANIKNN